MGNIIESSKIEVSSADWEATPASIQKLLLHLLQENQQLRQENQRLQQENQALRVRQQDLESRLQQLEERLNQNSQNSSQPPSSDTPRAKPVRRPQRGKRQRGGQPGHRGHERFLYDSEACQTSTDYIPSTCQHCGAALCGRDPQPYRYQVVELPPVEVAVHEYRLHQLNCPECDGQTRAWWPAGQPPKGYGPRLTALVGLLSGRYHLSHQLVQELLWDWCHLWVSLGSIQGLRQAVSTAVAGPVAAAKAYAQRQAVVGSDETSFAQHNGDGTNAEGKRGWLWALVTPWVSVFEIALSRSQASAKHLIGEGFGGIVISDRYGAYNWLPVSQRQVCWAHLQRDFEAMAQRDGPSATIGRALLSCQRRLFRWWHRLQAEQLHPDLFQQAVAYLRALLKAQLSETAEIELEPGDKTPLARTVRTCREILKLEAALWTFVTHPGVEPTNNATERALRPAVIWRRLSFGSQSQAGSEFVARILTVVTSLRAQERSVLDFLTQACRAARLGQEPPSLIPVAALSPHP